MKTILVFFVIAFLYSGEWLTDFDTAKAMAAKENKPILLNFSGSDWCGPCIKMKKQIFETEAFQKFADENLVLLRADFPRLKKNQLASNLRKHNESLAGKYNPLGKFPFTVLLDSNGKLIHEWDGYANQSPENFIKEVKDVISE